MNQTKNTDDEKNQRNKVFLRGGFWLILAGAVILSVIIYRRSLVFLPDLQGQYTFIGQNVLNVLILAAIAVQALVYRRQWDAMQQSLCQSREATERDQTAYVVFHSGNITQYKIGEPICALLHFINAGKTPAKDVTIYSSIGPKDRVPNVKEYLGDPSVPPPSRYVIAPLGGKAEITHVAGVLTQQVWADIQNTGCRIYVWGFVVYRDVFNRARKTSYCLVQDPILKEKLSFCPTGNDIDYEEENSKAEDPN